MTVSQFMGKLLSGVNKAKLTHLAVNGKPGSGFLHLAMGEFYDEFGELVDTFIESYQGKYGVLNDIVVPESSSDLNYAFMEGLANMLESESSGSLFKESWLKNMIDEMSQQVYHTLYKLKNMK